MANYGEELHHIGLFLFTLVSLQEFC